MSKYSNLKKYIEVKDGVDVEDLLFIHPRLLLVLVHIVNFCHQHKINFQLTSIIRTIQENTILKAVSKTHVEGRAFDFSIRDEHGWTLDLLKKLCNELNLLFGDKYGAVSKKNGQSRIIVIHDSGNGKHGHVQIRPGL